MSFIEKIQISMLGTRIYIKEMSHTVDVEKRQKQRIEGNTKVNEMKRLGRTRSCNKVFFDNFYETNRREMCLVKKIKINLFLELFFIFLK
jgi:Tfp pilus assembly protein PilV